MQRFEAHHVINFVSRWDTTPTAASSVESSRYI